MSFRTLIATTVMVASSLTITTPVHAQENAMETTIPKPARNGYVAVNGVNYYYAIYGQGAPLLLLHGGLYNTEMFGPVLTLLAQSRQVIGVDLHGHGRTSLGEREFSPVDIGNDLATIVRNLGYDQVDVLGYSMGGNAGLQFAAQHPTLVRRLALASASYAQSGYYPEMLPQQAALSAELAPQFKDSPIYTSYASIAPHPDAFPKLLDAMGSFMRKPYDWSADVKKLTMPVMLIYGDGDIYRPEHIVSFYQLLGGGLMDAGWERENMPKNRLAVLPDMTHYEIGSSPRLVHTVLPFLDSVIDAPNK